MGEQMALFKLTQEELERKARLASMLDLEIIQLQTELKEAQAALRECSEYGVVTDIKQQIKDAQGRLLRVHSELRAASRESIEGSLE